MVIRLDFGLDSILGGVQGLISLSVSVLELLPSLDTVGAGALGEWIGTDEGSFTEATLMLSAVAVFIIALPIFMEIIGEGEERRWRLTLMEIVVCGDMVVDREPREQVLSEPQITELRLGPTLLVEDPAWEEGVVMEAVDTNSKLNTPKRANAFTLEKKMLKRFKNIFADLAIPMTVFLIPLAAYSADSIHAQTFPSATEASQALVKALQNNDQASLLKIFGESAKDILSSGDEVEDKQNRDQFVQKYQQMHRLVNEPNGVTTLYIGAENWPAPIPLIQKGGLWHFDPDAGKQEILYRRIGNNELTMIQVCHELVDAEKEYRAQTHDDASTRQYAQKIMSDPGKHNGLYWKANAGEASSPLGPFVASAEREGYTKIENQTPEPFHGYYFKVLKSSGFAFLVYPAEYRSSGVMSFLLNEDGIVYEKDLGSKTADIAKKMMQYNRDKTWRKAD